MRRNIAFLIVLLLTINLSAQIHNAYLNLDKHSLCLNDTVITTNEFLPIVVDSMTLDFGTGFDTTIVNPVNGIKLPIIYDASGHFIIKLTAYLGTSSKYEVDSVDVYNYPSANFVDEFFPYPGITDTFHFSNRRYLFLASEQSATALHSWQINNELQMSESDSMGYNFPKVGGYIIKHSVELNGCKSLASSAIEIKEEEVEIPNIFTPNGDGQNDIFYVQTDGNTKYKFTVWNRHGGRVFIAENLKVISWDGYSYWGELLHPGTYYYVLESELGENYKGFIYLSR